MGTRPTITYTINGIKVEFDGDYYVELKENGNFDNRLLEALSDADNHGYTYIRVSA